MCSEAETDACRGVCPRKNRHQHTNADDNISAESYAAADALIAEVTAEWQEPALAAA